MTRTASLGLVAGAAALLGALSSRAEASVCDDPRPEWLMCEDFEGAPAGWGSWLAASGFVECLGCSGGSNDPDRLFLSDDPDHAFEGRYGLHMPAAAGSGHQGAELIFRSCAGTGRPGCALTNHERLYLRTRVKLAPDHQYVHHFLSLGGTRPDAYWEGSGNAGCRPNGIRHAGTTVDFDRDRRLFFYTYFPDMRCDSGGYCSGSYAASICSGCADRGLPCESGPECCWGNHFEPSPPVLMPRGEWVCLEMMMRLNTPGERDGEMAFWLDDVLAHRVTGMHWRDVEELGLNRANMSHYIAASDADRPNPVSFDDFIVSTARIGCDMTPAPDPPRPDAGAPPASDAGAASADGGDPAGPAPTDRDRDGGGGGGGAAADPGASPSRLSGGCAATRASSTAGSVWLPVLLLAARRRPRRHGRLSTRCSTRPR